MSGLRIYDRPTTSYCATLRYTIVDGEDNRSIAKKVASSKIAKTPPEEDYNDFVNRV
jgi:hypothetical protein